MFAALFAGLFQFLLFLGAVVLIYNIFVSEWWDAKLSLRRDSKSKFSNTDKIAQVKLVSNDRKDIEKFVTDNAQYLSDQMVKKLVARIETLDIDEVILSDDALKRRIETLPQQEMEAEDAQATRSQRTGH
jgi:hypothetical protein